MPRNHGSRSDSSSGGRKKRKWLRRIIVALVVILLILILLPIGARLYLSDARIRSMAEKTLTDSLGRKVTVGDFKMALLSSIELKDVVVDDKPEYGGKMMTLKNARVSYKALSVFGDTIEIPEIKVQGLQLHVVKTDDGKMNLTDLPPSPPAPPEPKKPPAPVEMPSIPNFTIRKIAVSDIGLEYEDKAAGQKIALDGFRLNATSSSRDNVLNLELSSRLERIVAETSAGAVKTAPPVEAALALTLDADQNAFEITKADVSGEGVTASLAGKGSFAEEKISAELDGSLFLDLAGATLAALSGVEGQSGTLNARLTASGTFPQLSAKVSIEGKDFAWPVDTGEERPAMFQLASLTAAEELSGREDQTVSVTGNVALRDIGITGKGQRIDAIDLTYHLEADTKDEPARLESVKLTGPGLDLSASGKVGAEERNARPVELAAELSIDLARAVEPLVPSVKNCQGIISLNAKAAGSTLAPVMDVVLSAPSIQATQTESGVEYRIEGLEATEKSALAEDQIHVPVKGSFRIARFTMQPPEGEAQSIHDLSMTHRAVLDTSRYDLDLESFDASLPGLAVTSKGSVKNALSDDPAVDITKTVTMNFDEILAWAMPPKQGMMEGILRVDASVSGSKKSPEVSLQAKSERLVYRAEESGVPVHLETSLDANVNVSGNIEENIRLAAEVKGLPRFVDSTGKEIDKADLAAVLRAGFSVSENRLELETASVNAFGLNTTAKGTVDAAGETPVANASADGELDLGGIAPLLRAVMGLSREECDAAGKAAFSIALAGDTNSQRAEVKATADRLELKYSPEEKAEEEEAEEEAAPKEEKEGPVPEAMDLTGKSALVTARVNTLVLNGVPISNLVCEIRSEGNQVEIKTIRGEMAGGTLDLAATADTGVPGWDFRIKGGAQHVGISSLVSLYDVAHADTVRGMASMNLELAGQGFDPPSLSKNLTGKGDISTATLELSPRHWLVKVLQVTGLTEFDKLVQFEAVQTDLTVADGAIQTQGLALRAKRYAAMFVGGIGLDGAFRDAMVTLRLPSDMASRLVVPGFEGQSPSLDEGEHFDLRIGLAGTVDDPKPRVEWKDVGKALFEKAITDILTGEEKSETKDVLKGVFDLFKPRK